MQQATVNQVSVDLLSNGSISARVCSVRPPRAVRLRDKLLRGTPIRQLLEVNANYFRSAPGGQRNDVKPQPRPGGTTTGSTTPTSTTPGPAEVILSGTLRERFSSRFSLLQLISRTEGQTTVAFGGDFTSNRLMARVDYQNVYLPFRPSQPF